MRNLRPHRFPPLAQLVANSGQPAGAAANFAEQPSFAEGFQEGLDRGYRDGYDSGLQGGRQDGVAAGREEGAAAGRREAQERFAQLAAPVDALQDALRHLQHDYQAALRKEVVDLVAKVARQVIRCELALQPVQLLALVDETLASMQPAADGVEVYLNPEELGRISELAPERAALWKLIPDPRLEPGECRVRAGDLEADAGCRQRLAACMEQVSGQLLDPQHPAEATEVAS
jgi:flagellar assembly protein FliH